jgi:hypothetical protein
MIARAFLVLTLLSICLLSTTILRAEEFQLSLVPTSTIGKDFGYKPRRIEMSPVKPERDIAIPTGVTAPLYGTLVLGPKKTKGLLMYCSTSQMASLLTSTLIRTETVILRMILRQSGRANLIRDLTGIGTQN